jgi:SAM-dependent methyltransferase
MTICPICAGASEAWAEVSDRHYGNPGTWQIRRCTACGALFIDPMPSEVELGSYYPELYYSHQPAVDTSSATGWRQRLRRVVLPIRTGEPDFTQCGRMLDVGCGSGWMLDHYAALGWQAEGVEYSEAATIAGRAAGRSIHRGSLLDAAFPDEHFDYVRSNHSFEHMNNPHEILDEMHRILKPGGTMFIGVPDSSGLTARLFGHEWYYVGAPVHVINYNRANLRDLVERHGFAVSRTVNNSNHGGTIGSLQSWVIGKRARGSLDGGMVASPPFILLGFWTAKVLDLLRLGDCVEITAVKSRP